MGLWGGFPNRMAYWCMIIGVKQCTCKMEVTSGFRLPHWAKWRKMTYDSENFHCSNKLFLSKNKQNSLPV